MRNIKLINTEGKQIGSIQFEETEITDNIVLGVNGKYYQLNGKQQEETREIEIKKSESGNASKVYSHPDCVFEYCPHPETCSKGNSCCIRDAD